MQISARTVTTGTPTQVGVQVADRRQRRSGASDRPASSYVPPKAKADGASKGMRKGLALSTLPPLLKRAFASRWKACEPYIQRLELTGARITRVEQEEDDTYTVYRFEGKRGSIVAVIAPQPKEEGIVDNQVVSMMVYEPKGKQWNSIDFVKENGVEQMKVRPRTVDPRMTPTLQEGYFIHIIDREEKKQITAKVYGQEPARPPVPKK